jgi:hypothetical protein
MPSSRPCRDVPAAAHGRQKAGSVNDAVRLEHFPRRLFAHLPQSRHGAGRIAAAFPPRRDTHVGRSPSRGPVSINALPNISENGLAVCPACAGETLALSAVLDLAKPSPPSSARPNSSISHSISATRQCSSAFRAAPTRGSGERTTSGFSFMIVSHLAHCWQL